MYDLSQVINGVEKYIHAELLSKMNPVQQFMGGMVIGRIRGNAVNLFNQYKNNEMVKMLNVIDSDDKINVDEIIKLANEQMDRGAITVNLAFIGPVTFNKDDVSKLANYIRG